MKTAEWIPKKNESYAPLLITFQVMTTAFKPTAKCNNFSWFAAP